MTSSLSDSTFLARSSVNGARDSVARDYRVSRNSLAAGAEPVFPPSVVVQVKALACEIPHQKGLPLSRFSISEIRREVLARGIVADVSGATLWRWLSSDAIRPWRYRNWIFPRDPQFAEKAGRVLDLYERIWAGKRLTTREFVLSADEKTSIQCRQRRHPSSSPRPHQVMRVEHEYKRAGAWAYLAAWDVHRAKVFGRCEAKTGIAATDRLVAQVMSREPYKSARRVFWIMDNGSGHRGCKAAARLEGRWPNIVLVNTPVHASWLNQIEIYFSIIQRKVLTPNDFASRAAVEERLLAFERRYRKIARPFRWTFNRGNLNAMLTKLGTKPLARAA